MRTRPIVVGALALGLSGTLAALALAEPSAASPFHNLRIFAEALSEVEASYVDPVDQEALIYGAIRGMLESLDPHSTFLTPEEYRLFASATEGRFAGVGVEVTVRDGWLTVLSVFPGGPAARAGLLPGDRFLVIEGRAARDMRIAEAVGLIRGAPGTAVRVTLRREGVASDLELELLRGEVAVSAVEWELLADRTLYLRVQSFQESTTAEVRAALDAAVVEAAPGGGLRGVLLDLRDNGGGLLAQAGLVADEFLEEGVIVSTRGRDGRTLGSLEARRAGTRPGWPLVVLVNGQTASASEIVAGALRDHGRAAVVGTRTFGKGSVQSIVELPDGSALKLTIARYYTPSGRSIQAQGIEPDLRIEAPPRAPEGGARPAEPELREEGLPRHLPADPAGAAPAGSPIPLLPVGPGAAWDGPLPPRLEADLQLAQAQQVLRGMAAAAEAARAQRPTSR